MHRITVIEDNPSLQLMYKMKFENSSFDVRTASDGKEGLEVIKKHQPDLILLDLNMPIMRGEEMLEELRKTDWGSNIRVVILTNISKDEAPNSLRVLGVDRYIVKAHTTPLQVLNIVKEILGAK